VDKKDFLHNVNGLRRFQAAGQTLFPERTLTGQKTALDKRGSFAQSILLICRGLSTAAGIWRAKPVLTLEAGLPDRLLAAACSAVDVVLRWRTVARPESGNFF
jgi:hypothetical protein